MLLAGRVQYIVGRKKKTGAKWLSESTPEEREFWNWVAEATEKANATNSL